MGSRYDTRRSEIDMDGFLSRLRSHFEHIPDPRNRIIGQSLADICMSALAMFSLKYLSLLQFDTQTEVERQNLQRVFGLGQVCSDTQMRRMLDQVDPVHFRDRLADYLVVPYKRMYLVQKIDNQFFRFRYYVQISNSSGKLHT